MIPPKTVAQIHDTAQVEEVISDFVTLKKRGANFIGHCPFHNERTPSFSVSPVKGIYKCFGCGKAGNSVKFVMEHEGFSYPEALRYLAKKYNIHIPEINEDEAREAQKERDSLFIVNQFAAEHFQNNLHNTDEGQNIGLSYFEERGFRRETIQKFQLGYSLNSFDALLSEAKQKGYRLDLLQKLKLVATKNDRTFDFFRERVMFSIHNLSGKVIAFAGRTLKRDKKIPKYVNSPETEIYYKSKVLYAMHLARNSIRQKDECWLVEGYTDVISLHQAGIEQVVASSGTSLTQEQVRLIKRYTQNICILYDGDAAGIKAAIRGVDLVLEAGMNVKIVVLPDGEDPDSFIRQVGKTAFEAYVKENNKDFIFFKTDFLLKEAGSDPVKKSKLIQSVIHTLVKIPDPIRRLLYVKECSQLLDISERVIINETNRLKQNAIKKQIANKEKNQNNDQQIHENRQGETQNIPSSELETRGIIEQKHKLMFNTRVHERELVRLLLDYGHKEIELDIPVCTYVIDQINGQPFQDKELEPIIKIYYVELEKGNIPDSDFFIQYPDSKIGQIAASILGSVYELSPNWEKMHQIFITDITLRFKQDILSLLDRYKLHHVLRMIEENLQNMKELWAKDAKSEAAQTQLNELLQTHMQLLEWKKQLAASLKTAIVR